MPLRPILVLCEGPHDIAFLTRLLGSIAGAQLVNLPVVELPDPFGNFFLARLSSRDVNAAKIRGSGPVAPDEPPLLEAVCKMPDDTRIWYFLNCCGDSRSAQINAFLQPIVILAQAKDPMKKLADVGFVFVNDADEIGITERQRLIVERHSATLAPLFPNLTSLTANQWQSNGGYGVGSCIFSAPGSDTGTLENIVYELWEQSHIDRRDRSRSLMDHLAAVPGTKIGLGSTPSKILKATLTTAGQTECPGSSLAVVLRETTALEANAMRADPSCNMFLQILLNT